MLNARTRAGWATGLLATTLATSTLSAVPAQAIAGGSPVAEGSYRFVAEINIGAGDNARRCTGALVTRQWVATASTCFADTPEQGHNIPAGRPKHATTATIGRTSRMESDGHVVNVTTLVPHPDRDLVLAKLARPVVDVVPVKIGTTAPAQGDVLRVAGYGRTATEWVPDVLHTGTFRVEERTASTLAIVGTTPEASICLGDAGGPAMREAGGRAELVAVNHSSWQHGCLGVTETRNGATETRVDDLVGWIGEKTAGMPRENFDGLGKTNVLTYDATGESLYLYPNTSKPGESGRGERIDVGAGWRTVKDQTLADYDGDGKTDVLGRVGVELWWWRNITTSPTKPLFAARHILRRDWNTVGKFVLTDFDGDGKVDVLGYDPTGETLSLYLNTSTAEQQSLAGAVAVGKPGWRTVKDLMVADYDGDGMVDVIGRVGSQLWMWRNTTASPTTPTVATGKVLRREWNTVGTFVLNDQDSDGKVDILAYDAATGDALYAYLNTSTADEPSLGARIEIPPSGWRTVQEQWTADYDGDGKTDLIGRAGNDVWVWRNITTTPADPKVAAGFTFKDTKLPKLTLGKFLIHRVRF